MFNDLRDFVFVPYENYLWLGPGENFAKTKLARGLEFTKDKFAPKLQRILGNCRQIQIVGFERSDLEPLERTFVLYRKVGFDLDQRIIASGYWDDNHRGYAFGVLDSQKKK